MVRGSNPGGGEIFHTCPDRAWGPPSLLYNGYRVFPGGKERSGRDADPSPPSSAVDHERVELYLYSPYGQYGLDRASVPVQGWPLPFHQRLLHGLILYDALQKKTVHSQSICDLLAKWCQTFYSRVKYKLLQHWSFLPISCQLYAECLRKAVIFWVQSIWDDNAEPGPLVR